MKRSRKECLAKAKEILLIEGDLTPNQYDELKYPDKPSRSTMRKHIGGWQVVKSEALGETTTLNKSYLVKQNEKLLKQLEKQRNLNQVFIDNCLASISKISFSPTKVPSPEKVISPQQFHAMKSDDHAGEVVDPKWVQGISEYNSDMFKTRNETWLHKVCTFREQDRASLGLNKLVIHILGDIVTGEMIYPGQAYSIDAPVVDQVMMCLEIYTNIILHLAEEFPEIEIFAIQGNHGRYGRKGEGHPRSNFDYLLYRMLQKALIRQENIKVFVSESPTMLVKHGNFNFALNHNDDTRAWSGIPYYGLDRKARRLGDLYGIHIHYKLGGHFHSPANLNDETLLNGTLMGGSDLSINKMRVASRPSQKIFYFDPEHGIHRESNLYLAEAKQLTPDEHGIYTAYT